MERAEEELIPAEKEDQKWWRHLRVFDNILVHRAAHKHSHSASHWRTCFHIYVGCTSVTHIRLTHYYTSFLFFWWIKTVLWQCRQMVKNFIEWALTSLFQNSSFCLWIILLFESNWLYFRVSVRDVISYGRKNWFISQFWGYSFSSYLKKTNSFYDRHECFIVIGSSLDVI